MAEPRPKTGGRQAGTPNKSSRALKTFLDGVFTEAFADPDFRVNLLIRIKSFELDSKVLLRLLEYWAGAPTKQHNHTGTVSLAQLIAGTAPDTEDDDE